ncbi:MAG: hypothetical protein ABSD42_09370 [Candidatus Bathyarchaeia archaeon]|jgi:hypothetical protein
MATETEIDFEILREPWSKYKLEDGTLLRLKNPVLHVFKSSENDQQGLLNYRTAGCSLMSALIPKELLGKPSEKEEKDSKDTTCEMKFSVICEDWCDYKASDGMILKTKTEATQIRKSKKFNRDGEPMYFADCKVLTGKLKL